MTRTFALHRHPHYNYDGSQLYNNSTLSDEHLSKGLPLQIVIYTYAAYDNIIPQLNVHTCKRCNTPHCFHLSSKVIQEKQQRATVWRSVAGGKQQTVQAKATAAGNASASKPRCCARTLFSPPKIPTTLHAPMLRKEQNVSRPCQE